MTNYNDGKWHGWTGGVMPVHKSSIVSTISSNGRGSSGYEAVCFSSGRWGHTLDDFNIVAFRVTKEYKEPREYWIYRDSSLEYVTFHSKPSFSVAPDGNKVIHVREVVE